MYSVFYFMGDFTIANQSTIIHKNSLGAILSNAGAIVLCLIVLKGISKYGKIGLILFGTSIFACLLVFRSRADFLALLFCFLVVIWLLLRNKKGGYFIIGTIIIAVVILYLYSVLIIPEFLNNFFLGNTDLSDLNSISSDRLDRNVAALKFISRNPLFGQLTNPIHLDWVHNYVLLEVSQFGLVGSFPLLCLYFYMIWTIIIRISKIKEFRTEHFGYIVMIIPLFISLLEPSFPYGPGSVQVIVYFMLGYSLKKSFIPNFNID